MEGLFLRVYCGMDSAFWRFGGWVTASASEAILYY